MSQQVTKRLIQKNCFLPRNSKGYVTSKFRTNEINEVFYGHHYLWLKILNNKSFEDNFKIKKGALIGFIVIEVENLKFHSLYTEKEKKVIRQKIKRQIGGFLNCYDLAYAGRDRVNQAAKVAPGAIKGATNKIDKNCSTEN